MSRFLIVSAALVLFGCQKQSGGDSKSVDELTERVKKLEAENERNKEAMAFLHEALEGQKAQQKERDAQEPAEDAVFAVDIAQNVADMSEGPPDALVTIVEAWDFA